MIGEKNELSLEEMTGEMVSKDSNLEAQIKTQDGSLKVSVGKEETQEQQFLNLREIAKQIAAQERIKAGVKVIFDTKKEGANVEGVVGGFQLGDKNTVLLSEDAVKAGKFSVLIELNISKSGRLTAINFEFNELKEKIRSGEVKILD
jgi:hypothetical protein